MIRTNSIAAGMIAAVCLLVIVNYGCNKKKEANPNDAGLFALESWRNSRSLDGFTYLRKTLGPGTETKYVQSLLGEPDTILKGESGGETWRYTANDAAAKRTVTCVAHFDAKSRLLRWELVMNAPPKSTDRFIGMSIDELKAELGKPDVERQGRGRPDFGPYPESLAQGTPYTYLHYADQQGQQLHVYCVSPEVFQKATGRNPGDKGLCVLAVFTYPKGTVF